MPFEEIDAFREKMISVIREVGKSKKVEPVSDDIITKNGSIKRIENLLKKRSIKIEELELINRNYKEAINNAGKTSEEIIDVEDRIKDDIIMKSNAKEDSKVEVNTKGPSRATW